MRLVGQIVRDEITNAGLTFSDAARRWPMSLPTLNRLMSTGNVGLRFYAIAENNLPIPRGLLSLVADGDTDAIGAIPGIDEGLRARILGELGDPPTPPGRRPRRPKAS